MISIAFTSPCSPGSMSDQQTFHSGDIESQVSSTACQHHDSIHDVASPMTYKAPRRRQGSPSSRGTLPKELPRGVAAAKRKDILDQVFHAVDYDVCRTQQEPEITDVMKRRVIIEEHRDVDEIVESLGDVSKKWQHHVPRASPPSSHQPGKSPKSILRRGKFEDPPPQGGTCTDYENDKRDAAPSVQSEQSKRDLLDYIFENVESFVCRHGKSDNNGKESRDDNDDMSVVKNGGDSSPEQLQRLYKVSTTDNVEIRSQKRDVLDYLFECGGTDDADQALRIYPTPVKDRDILDYIFECGGDTLDLPVDSRDPSVRAPMSPSERHLAKVSTSMRDANSLIHVPTSLELIETPRIGRVEILRKKKRQLEEQRRMVELRGDETQYWVSKGHPDAIALVETSSRVSSTAMTQQLEQERSRRIQRMLILGMVMSLMGIALVVVAIQVFFPMGGR